MPKNAVIFEQVTKSFNHVTVVSKISCVIPTGSVYGLLGANGAGKTTMLRMLTDIIAPDKGEIRLFDNNTPGVAMASKIGYLPEERGLYLKMKIREILLFFGLLRGMNRHDAKRSIDYWIDRLNLGRYNDSQMQELSRGLQQKVQFITALIHSPDLVILDEPWTGLDAINVQLFHDIILSQKQAGKTILLSTHLLEQAEHLCDSVCIVSQGKKIVEGTLQQIIQGSASKDALVLSFVDFAIQQKACAIIESIDSTITVKKNNKSLEVFLPETIKHNVIITQLISNDIDVTKFESVTPTLRDVFMRSIENATTDNQFSEIS